MQNTKVLVKEVLNASDRYDVVFAELHDSELVRKVQICMPKYCQMPSLVGKEICYSIKNGKIIVKQVDDSSEENLEV